MKRSVLCAFLLALYVPAAHAVAITAGPTLAGSPVTSETNPLTNGVTVSMTVDGGTDHVQIVFSQVSPVDSSLTPVATITPAVTGGSSPNIFWSALWFIGTDLARRDGSFSFQATPIGGSTIGTPSTPGSFTITSVDIHNLTVTSSLDASGQPTFPFRVSYALAKAARVSASILNSSGTVIRTLLTSQPQGGEVDGISTNTVNWDGIRTDGTVAPIGNYSVQVGATDLATGDPAIVRTRPFSVVSLAGASSDPQKVFESNVFVYPNPVRNSQGSFQMEAVRDGANLSLKIYTITGTLVFEKSFPGIPTGTITTFNWDGTNGAGNKVGRGLYYYVVREDDAAGSLQTVKKMAVIP